MDFQEIIKLPKTKRQIREEMKLKRSLYPQDQKLHDSNIIARTLLSLDIIAKANSICTYVSMSDEVNTKRFIMQILKKNRQLVIVPKVKSNMLQFFRISDFKHLKESKFGILEPDQYCQQVALMYPELIITPGLAFSPNGYRIGYGAGYYDKVFSQTQAPRIALAFDFQVLETVPHEEYDRQVDLVITPTRIINCTKKIKL